MMLMDEVKLFLREYSDHSDALIQAMIDSAQELVEGSTGKEYQGSNLEKLAIKLLVRHWYDNETEDIPFGVQTMLTQIEYEKEDN